MPLADIRKLLGSTAELASVRAQTRKQAALQKAFEDCTPVELAHVTKASRVGYIKAGTLYLLADHAAAAAKLRQLLPRLLPVLHNLEPEVTAIKVEVQVKGHASGSGSKPQKPSLPIESIEKFSILSHAVKDPALKSALTNLVRRRSKR